MAHPKDSAEDIFKLIGVEMPVEEHMLGFDCREMWQAFKTTWPQWRKDLFLLKHEIEKPLSTDTTVWPSIFDDEEDGGWRGHQFLWASLAKMQAHMETTVIPYWMIGISVVLHNSETQQIWQPIYAQTTPSQPETDWTLLGYDVADFYLLSGLMNCGYEPAEIDSLAIKTKAHLNQYHLFSNLNAVHEFREISDQRATEHAPFFVYGLYLIPTIIT